MNLIKYEIIKYKEKSVFRIIESNIPCGSDGVWNTIPFIKVSGTNGFDNRFYINEKGHIILESERTIRSKEIYLFGPKTFKVDGNNQICIGIPYRVYVTDEPKYMNDTWIFNKDVEFITTVLNNVFTELKKYIK